MIGLYLHIPLCAAICNYCNFNRGLFDESLKQRYVDALECEIRNWQGFAPGPEFRIPNRESRIPHSEFPGSPFSALPPRADTIYFGGGTPSLLMPADVGRIVGACREAFDVAPDAEVTLEANPETVSIDRLTGYREAGVTRLSLGVQSFRDAELARLSRLHTADRAREAFETGRAAGFANISLDLMMWLPGQTPADWAFSVEQLIALGPEHVSFYLLEVYPNAPLRDEMARGGWSLAPDEDAAEMYGLALDRLSDAGYRQYEISNAARPMRQSRHNLKYWIGGSWLGFGCGAHATVEGLRWRNVPGTTEYMARVAAGRSPVAETRRLSATERWQEALFMGLRLTEGLDVPALEARYGRRIRADYGRALDRFAEAGLLEASGDRVRLTRRGMLLANEVMSAFV